MTNLMLHAQTSSPLRWAWAAMQNRNYRYDVTGYCGLLTRQVHQILKETLQIIRREDARSAERADLEPTILARRHLQVRVSE